jgi:RNA-dependent RNA polymerase
LSAHYLEFVSFHTFGQTPSRQVGGFIDVETSNRFVRQFVEGKGFRSESFLRLQVCDENFEKFYFSDLTEVIVSRIKTALTEGIVVNGIRYWFLAYSSSQLKDFSLWMVFPEKGETAEGMREKMGDFTMCRNPSEYSARIGQCLSTTFQGLAGQDTPETASKYPVLRHLELFDIHARGNMIHSDGCGVISENAMKQLLQMLPRPSMKVIESTSGVQIRYGGAKGFLVSWEQRVIDNIVGIKDSPYDVLLRKSMVKFKADYKFLEICR